MRLFIMTLFNSLFFIKNINLQLGRKSNLHSSKLYYDVAFQKYVITKAFPGWNVHAFLMLADKNSAATVDGLNQKFQLKTVEDERTIVEIVGVVSREGLGEEVLIRICVDDLIIKIFQGTDSPTPASRSFVDYFH